MLIFNQKSFQLGTCFEVFCAAWNGEVVCVLGFVNNRILSFMCRTDRALAMRRMRKHVTSEFPSMENECGKQATLPCEASILFMGVRSTAYEQIQLYRQSA